MTGLKTLPKDATDDEVCAALDADGAVILEDVADETVLAKLWDDLGSRFDGTAWGEEGFLGNRTRRVCSLFAKSMVSGDLVTERRYLAAARYYLQRPFSMWMGEERIEAVPEMQIGVGHGVQIWPGETIQGLHRDDVLHLNRHPGPETRVLMNVALSDFTAENGGTRIIPGSHTWDDERAPKESESLGATMKAGSGLVWLGSTYHCGGPNTSDGPRTGLIYALDSGCVRQEENQYLAVPMETVRAYPEEVQWLLGYHISPPFCGYVEMGDPLEFVNGERKELTATSQGYGQ